MRKGFVVPGFVPALLLVFLCLSIMGCVERGPPTLASPNPFSSVTPQPTGTPAAEAKNLKSFTSWKDVALFASSSSSGYYGRYYDSMPLVAPNAKTLATTAEAGGAAAADYSTTNVQVEGVDEADIVKNDGKYIYVVGETEYPSYEDCGWWTECVSTQSTRGKILVMQAYPPSEAKIVSTIRVDGAVSEIFIYGDKLVAFGSRDSRFFPPLPEIPDFPIAKEANAAQATPQQGPASQAKIAVESSLMPRRPYYYDPVAFVEVFDIADKSNPKHLKTFEVRGNYVQSRMIDGRVYGVFNENVYPEYPVPLYAVDGVTREIAPSEIKYFDWPSDYYNFQIFLGFDLNSLEKQESRKIIMAGYSQNIYASKNAFYLTNTRYDYYSPQWEAYHDVYWTLFPADVKEKIAAVDAADFPAWAKERIKAGIASRAVYESINYSSDAQRDELAQRLYQKLDALSRDYALNAEKTVINKIALTSDGGFVFAASGEVPGHALNQFSMDESEGYFRIATTAGQLSRSGSVTSNNLYVLDSGLKTVGKIEGLAPGESIYSARFLGKKAYLVTFKKVDPFFVLDLSDPTHPTLLGKLKIPGYSDYLHPYDENHVIGLGKGAVAAEEGDFAWYQGVKLSLFDVTDLANPKEIAKFEIGDRGTDSNALQDHKAFLFNRQKNLLVIPVLLAEINEAKYPLGVEPNTYGDFVFQGAYVFSVSPELGFVLKGRVTHASEDSLAKSGEYYYSQAQVKRSLYMNDYLYTVSDEFVKANDLRSSNLQELASIRIQ